MTNDYENKFLIMPGECVFCDIIQAEIAEGFRYEGSGVVSFEPLNPVTPGHRLFVPMKHTNDASQYHMDNLSAFKFAGDWGAVKNEDFNIITSRGVYASQTVFHTHLHYVPRRKGDGLLLPWSNQHKADMSGPFPGGN